MLSIDDTIVGIASPPGGGARGVVRVSGPETVSVMESCFAATTGSPSQMRRPTALSGVLRLDPPLGELPGELYVWPDERSYTRQPSAEFHTFGSAPLLEAVVQVVCRCGARLAEPGEFTLRAFLSGRLDLTQAEAVLGVIDARDRTGLEIALSQLAGGLSRPLDALRAELLDILAELEAGLDFVEEDIQFIQPAQLQSRLASAAEHVEQLAEQLERRSHHDDQAVVVLYGWPNVGKSSLFNALVGEAAAIVSDQAGTTRDYLMRTIELDGYPVLLVDTAGKESTVGHIAAAQTLGEEQTRRAQLRVLCLDGTRALNDWEQGEAASPDGPLIVVTKADAGTGLRINQPVVRTSAREARGLDELQARIRERLLGADGDSMAAIPATAVRCRESLRRAASAVDQARQTAASEGGDELVAAELRIALEELGHVVGTVYTDDILDRIFSRFCIGK